MTISVEQKVYYAGRGPYLIAELVPKVVCGVPAKFYRFVLLDGSGDEFLVLPGNASLLPLRALTPVNKVPELLNRLKARSGPPQRAASWRERDLVTSKVFASGSASQLVDLIESLTRSSGERKLAADEWEALRRARKLLIAEIAVVMDESSNAAELRIDKVLNAEHNVVAGPTEKFKRYFFKSKLLKANGAPSLLTAHD